MHEYVFLKYIRLSLEDGITESLSIPHQRLILNRHIEELDVPNAKVLEFVDNGYSGTNMERPAIQEMLDLVRSGGVNCIVVKDFSRFSRNALESGYFIEQVFPLYRVRFISVSDNFDSDNYKHDTGGIDVAFKFLMHEYYSIDLSKKVKSAKRVKMLRGEHIVANAIYGYQKNELSKWELDHEPAEIVRFMFRMVLDGLSTAQIRDRFCEAKCPTPREYMEIKRGKNTVPKCMWTARMVWHTLTNEQYTGSYISGKQESKAVGSHSKTHNDKSKWIVIPDSHPPIVSKEDFETVQAIINRYKSSTTAKPVNNTLQDDVNRPHRERMINGERLTNNPIYGYIKAANGELKIDPPAANIIQEIYKMASQSLSIEEIRNKLTEAGYPIPSEHIKLGRGYDVKPMCQWTNKCVRGILQNVQYTGAYVSGKILKNYETGKKYHTAQSDWVVIPDKNPAIVSKELFETVQGIFVTNKEKQKKMRPRDYLLRGGIFKCGCCGYAMIYDNSCRNTVYRCSHTHGNPNAECYKLKVSTPELDEVVCSLIRKQSEIVLNRSNILDLRKTSENAQNIIECEKQIALCMEQQQRAYERFFLREIDRKTYFELKKDFSERIERLNSQLMLLKQTEHTKRINKQSMALAKQTLSETAISRGIIESLVEKVLVFPNNQIEVNWKIADFATVT